MEKIPAHIAIIMDGNGRWAEAQGKEGACRLCRDAKEEKPAKQG